MNAATISAIAAGVSALCAALTYRQLKKAKAEKDAEDQLVAGRPAHPKLLQQDHSQAVVFFALVNKSQKKAYVTDVLAFDGRGQKIDITWSDQIDEFGGPIAPSHLVNVVNSCHIYVRQNSGEWFSFVQLKIFHSLNNSPLVIALDPAADLE
jgi:hypothetical protein